MFNSFRNPDIIIGIGDHEFYCHRLVLQSYSEYFDEFNNLDSFTHIDISEMNVTKTAFIAIYSWMLSLGQGGFQHLKRENILEVLIACQCLKIKDYENQCLAFIDDKTVFSEDNAYFLFVQASRLKEKSIMELMIPRIQAFFLTLVSSKNFLELGPDDLCVILQSNYIVVHGEQEIFMSAIRWLMHDWKGRYEYMHTVMKCVRFGLMTPSQLIEIRKNPEIPEFKEITQDKEVQKLIEDGLA
ncbi:hypothetical protein AAG570_000608 [Ranatra chinensis]|uniref:BTB domain-containing protein n=1 Tax=Ranatra chinensis TaxID=642074 RepID=A0ABD0ZIR4_9HEMI